MAASSFLFDGYKIRHLLKNLLAKPILANFQIFPYHILNLEKVKVLYGEFNHNKHGAFFKNKKHFKKSNKN